MIRHAKTAILGGVSPLLLSFAERNDLFVTSGRDGVHNSGSKHPLGEAIDFRTRGLTQAFWEHLERDAQAHGLTLLDERQRPPGQKIWSGPHAHLQT